MTMRVPRWRPPMHFLQLNRMPILQQLKLEEALLRANFENWCIYNHPPESENAIILGISGKPAELVHCDAARSDQIPLIRRFSGGGTVFIDANIRCVSLILNSAALPDVKSFPRPIMSWTAEFYTEVFGKASRFCMRDNDYCFGNKKFAGNAQSIVKDRWIHHTSFVWEEKFSKFEKYLKYPQKVPEYRQGRSHSDFLCSLDKHFQGEDEKFRSSVLTALESRFKVENHVDESLALLHLNSPYMKTTRTLDPSEYGFSVTKPSDSKINKV
eukprot:gb/GEZN01012985.1/.p1 GENE.gb/GEZN01012985.1/~~gb/GEZN01012985.1/.p1  ORF type:complete len:270 (+),score=13.85 gb/GEZN01012985.1/:203-1012(+)